MKASLLTLAAALAALILSAGAAADASHPRTPFMPTTTASAGDEHAGHGAAHAGDADDDAHGGHADEAPTDEHDDHGASLAPSEPAERPRTLVLGGFAGANALVLSAAALVSRRDRRRRAARQAAIAARSAT